MKSERKKSSSFWKIITLVLIVFAIKLLWTYSHKKDDTKPIKQTRAETKTKKKKTPNAKATQTAATTPSPAAKSQKEIKFTPLPPAAKMRQIPKDHVEFELLNNNIAVAFGDVILGRLESEMTTQRGLFKPTKSKLWPSNVIPFIIKDGIQNTQGIVDALKYFNDNTDVQFIARTEETEGIVFEPWDETKCASYVGRIDQFQPIFIGPNCGTQEVLHEVMHALGFVHEQSRTDRDRYVRILWDNILDGFQNQFDIVPDAYIHPYTGSVFNFDYESVMLYRPESFAKSPGLKTIEAVGEGKILPVMQGLSARDLERLHYLYGN